MQSLGRKVEALAVLAVASAMLVDAFRDKADAFVLVSGDTDFIAPVSIVRKDFGKTVLVFNPRERGRGFATTPPTTRTSRETSLRNASCQTSFPTGSAATDSSAAPTRGSDGRDLSCETMPRRRDLGSVLSRIKSHCESPPPEILKDQDSWSDLNSRFIRIRRTRAQAQTRVIAQCLVPDAWS